jgi:uncharacterized protein (DUF58 family)
LADAGTDYRKYLDPQTLAKISALDLRARMVVEGFVAGMHRSPYKGFNIEFAEHREYVQSDDIKHLDWKVLGRTDKYYIKQYEEETNLHCVLVVDCSESMAYGSDPDGLTKHEYATATAASLAYLALQQHDSVGLALFNENVTHYLRPTNHSTQWKTLVHELEGATGPKKTSLRQVLDELVERIGRRALIVLLSDLFDDSDEVLNGLKHLRYRRHDLIVLQVMDPAELSFPFAKPTLFEGLEATGKLLTEPRALRARYLDEVKQFTERLRRGCRDLRIDFTQFDTRTSLSVALSAYLATRGASIK